MAEPALSRNPVSIAGAALTTISAALFVVYLTLEAFGVFASPYIGLVGYLLIPALFVVGLLLIPLGMWREGGRRRRGTAPWAWPAIDFNTPRTRLIAAVVVLLTILNVCIIAVASVGVVEYTESDKFCGEVCHTPMRPQYAAHAVSAHSKVTCVSCHVGPGAKGFVTAKMNGTRQMYLLATNRYAHPIPEPIGRIPGAADTCAQCHTPGRPNTDLTRVLVSYGDDEKSTDTVTNLTMKMSANHWHARADVVVEYVSSDASRQTIPYVRATDASGKTTEYFADGVTSRPAGAVHRMDCLDCHNRPAHTLSATAERAVDGMIAAGGVNRDVSFVRREILAAVKVEYATSQAADAGIATHLTEFYRAQGAVSSADVPRVVSAAQQLYRQNVFPEMKVTWGTYISNLGHIDAPGCFRCHDDSHKARDARVIRQDCEMCHTVK